LRKIVSASHIVRSDAELNAWIGRILAGPDRGDKPFVLEETDYTNLYSMAGDLLEHFQISARQQPVCLCAEDKTVVGAALLASLAGGPALILPHSLAPQVLAELKELTGFRVAIVDMTRPVPDGVHCIAPRPTRAPWPPVAPLVPKVPGMDWVHLFTGGSTGAPKMWRKSVRNLLAETISIIEHYSIRETDRLVATVSPCHIYGLLYAILTPLMANAAVASQNPSFPGEIEAVVRQSRASVLISVPAHYRALNGHSFAPRSLRLAFSSAGMLAQEDAEAFSVQTGIGIAEVYGSTETGGIAARVRADGETDFKPYATVDVCIEAEHLKVRSDYLSPGLTLCPQDYFTVGDRVADAGNGRFRLLGRADGIVKVGGNRVDLEVVRQTIKRYPGVRDALVISLPMGQGRENRILALVEADLDAAVLNKALMRDLEPHARPRGIKVVAQMPLTAAGKPDRKIMETLFEQSDLRSRESLT
jgi:acyl-CoA synthetase (AMP-forming)/AMP-acid ligase II